MTSEKPQHESLKRFYPIEDSGSNGNTALNIFEIYQSNSAFKKIPLSGFKRKPERPESPPDNKPRPSEGSESGKKRLLVLDS